MMMTKKLMKNTNSTILSDAKLVQRPVTIIPQITIQTICRTNISQRQRLPMFEGSL